MSRYSDHRKEEKHAIVSEPPAPQWMVEADRRDLAGSLQSLMDAFNDIEAVVNPIAASGADLLGYDAGFETNIRLSGDCTTLYNECEYLSENYSAKLNPQLVAYLHHLRNLCAHRFGSSMNTTHFVYEMVYSVLPMKESIRSMIHDVLKENPDRVMRDRLASFNRKGPARRRRLFERPRSARRPIRTA